MGLFDCACAESGLIIEREQRLIVIEQVGDVWVPIALPIAGVNNRYGTMDMPSRLDANMNAVARFGTKLAYRDRKVKPATITLAAMLDEIRGDGSGAAHDGRAVSFALIEAGIYRAVVDAVAATGATAWTRYARLHAGHDATAAKLCKAVLATPTDPAPRQVLVDHLLERDDPHGKLLALLPAVADTKPAELVAAAIPQGNAIYADADPATLRPASGLVRFLAWGTELRPTCGEGQFSGFTKAKYDSGVEPYVTAARDRYAGMPELLEICDRNEAAWRSRGRDNEHDGD
jgi:hypothetical protein